MPTRRNNTRAMAVRFNIIRAFIGIPGMGRKKLLENGFLVGTHLWGHAYDDVIDNGLESMPDIIIGTGRSPVSDELRIAIKEHVLTDEYTKTLPASERSKTKDARALIKSIRQIYEEFPNNDEIGYDAFKNQLSGKKDSAVPNLRQWLHETDKCPECPQHAKVINNVKTFIAGCPDEFRAGYTTQLDDLITYGMTHPDNEFSRGKAT